MTFNEANSVRDYVRDQSRLSGWKFIEGINLDRQKTESLVESSFRNALMRLNPTIVTSTQQSGCLFTQSCAKCFKRA